ncbi:MAG TPA: cupin domain-containing protein [Dyella sp.]|uniref:cupin domain-containing protein n=1 Tax=Dyella sp. TaxID=1869338 RepID=UPI002CC77ABD|nr:cupin domain-containing protein [Dyella sp.]HUB90388.1 cupin domain-containing protein [Dyella sp.]
MTASVVDDIIQKLGLQPHPEGGFYRRNYCADEWVAKADGTQRHASTGIYYLLHDQAYSAWHRIDSDEMWHFYAGDPLLIHSLDSHGAWNLQRLGNMLHQPDAVFQCVVPAGCWFAAEREGSQGYSLVGCTVAPGFEFAAFELADTQALISRHPEHQAVIRRLAPR